MSLEIDVLRALLRLARRRTPPTLEQLVVRVGGEEADVRSALASLAKSGLVQRTPAGLRLSLSGLAVAVACAQAPAPRGASAGAVVAPARPPPPRRLTRERSSLAVQPACALEPGRLARERSTGSAVAPAGPIGRQAW